MKQRDKLGILEIVEDQAVKSSSKSAANSWLATHSGCGATPTGDQSTPERSYELLDTEELGNSGSRAFDEGEMCERFS